MALLHTKGGQDVQAFKLLRLCNLLFFADCLYSLLPRICLVAPVVTKYDSRCVLAE